MTCALILCVQVPMDLEDGVPLPSFGVYVAAKWCRRQERKVECWDEARRLAETFLFDRRLGGHTSSAPVADFARLRGSECLSQEAPDALLHALDEAGADYFGQGWDRVDEMVTVNEARLDLWKEARVQEELESDQSQGAPTKRTRRENSDLYSLAIMELRDEDAMALLVGDVNGTREEKRSSEGVSEELMRARLVLLEIYAWNCPQCIAVQPIMIRVAELLRDDPRVLVARVEGPANPELLEQLDIQTYPSIKLVDRASGTVCEGPSGSAITPTSLVQLIKAYLDRQPHDSHTSTSRHPAAPPLCPQLPSVPASTLHEDSHDSTSTTGSHSPGRALKHAPRASPGFRRTSTHALAAHHSPLPHLKELDGSGSRHELAQLAELSQKDKPPSFECLQHLTHELACSRTLSSRRMWSSATEIFRALGCYDEASCRALTRPHTDIDPPKLILLGGGMGAGKTSIKALVTKTEFWRRYGQTTVQVEADVFKEVDPVYQLLQKAKLPEASHRVHQYSTQAAEELLVQAVKYRRDIVFDSTLAWEPFLQQMLAMVRDTKHSYRRGPGYKVDAEGNAKEAYWEVEGEERHAEMTVPYRVELVGVYVKPEVAVRRAIVRRLLTGRGVPVREQLKSHKLFAQNFEKYAPQMDTVALYDNNFTSQRGKDPEPRLIAKKDVDDKDLVVLDAEAYERFRALRRINVDATCVTELYGERAA